MTFVIEQYGAAWKPSSNDGIISCKSVDGESQTIELRDPAEFTAILTILATSDNVRIDKDGTIRSGREELGD